MMTDNWRTIDIDQYDEDAYTEDEILAEFESGISPQEADASAQTRSTDVRNFLTKGDLNNALLRALEDPPYGRQLAQAKLTSTQTLLEVLNLFRADDIASVISSLSIDQKDLLMKYLYAGLAKPELYNSGVLLTWHEKLVDVVGTGCIVRVMSDKRTVF
ncbi:arp2/3 complex [Zychaea mexicana]|uniref:arp2/3 complex n=1 Tax=Zychaea mexicana TaxID=64656 RepID=UPI0022FED3A4|nr:arp2/3 complex [Zychaea mexicana]KAI9484454.1 arp2/3 complex [Zychaea mexicana]